MQLQIDSPDTIKCTANVKMASSDSSEDEASKIDIDKIFIIDHQFALDQIDFIENCAHLKNVVVIDSVLKHLNKV